MNFLKYPDEGDGAFQMAPLIDIVFNVLVFYLVTSALQQAEKQMAVNPPAAKQGDEIIRRPYQILINIAKDGEVIVNRKAWEIATLSDRLKELRRLTGGEGAPDFSVIIRADGLTAHQNVVNVMDACLAAGMNQMSFVTVDREK
jgi:biopolymer transport protein ExbD